MKKYFKIYELRKEPEQYGIFRTQVTLEETHFGFVDYETHEECEKAIQDFGVQGINYAIIQVFQKEVRK